jgi:uncharacterized integral membrane protein
VLASAGRILRTLIVTAIAILFLAFAVDNHDTVDISLFPLPVKAEMPKFLLAILCVILGAVVAACVAWVKMMKLRRQWKEEHQRVKALENEVKALQLRPAETLPAAAIKG